MKNWKHIIRLIGVLIIGALLLKMTLRFKYSTFMFDLFFYGILAFTGISLLIWSIITDLKQFKKNRNFIKLLPLGIGLILTILIVINNWKINKVFDKPTLLRIYYDGDFNGTAIDFKNDGTYIFDNSAIGLSDFIYGTYQITDNQIILDKTQLDNIVKTNKLRIIPKTINYSEGDKKEDYVFQIDKAGNIMKNQTEFRVVVDNRK